MSSKIQEVNGTVEGSKNAVNYTEVASNVTMAKELPLLDERSLLACIVRAIPPGSNNQIKISSTVSALFFSLYCVYIRRVIYVLCAFFSYQTGLLRC